MVSLAMVAGVTMIFASLIVAYPEPLARQRKYQLKTKCEEMTIAEVCQVTLPLVNSWQ